MTQGKPAKHILRFAVPLILTNVGQQLYMIADGAIVGRGVGVKALAAVGATDWCYWLILWSVIGLTQGFSTYVSRAFGEKNYRELNKAIATSTALCLITGAVLTVLGLVAAQPVLLLLQTPADVLPDATLYLCVLLAGTGIVIAYNMAASILRALGDGRTPLVAMIIAALLNIPDGTGGIVPLLFGGYSQDRFYTGGKAGLAFGKQKRERDAVFGHAGGAAVYGDLPGRNGFTVRCEFTGQLLCSRLCSYQQAFRTFGMLCSVTGFGGIYLYCPELWRRKIRQGEKGCWHDSVDRYGNGAVRQRHRPDFRLAACGHFH